ncbi:MAG TPA: hypothetical protein VK707_03030 [Solirubrobacteraceae bacterium]|jgi:hypothetical protein|nr:hypothetical protein [Solirubrobacteraceae bacterium]
MPQAYADRARAARPVAARRKRPSKPARAASGAIPRVRWDRVGRLTMLCVLAALLYLYLSAGLHMYSTWGQSRREKAAVATLEREHASLARQHEALGRQGTIEAEARRLGMKRSNELQYELGGLPAN